MVCVESLVETEGVRVRMDLEGGGQEAERSESVSPVWRRWGR